MWWWWSWGGECIDFNDKILKRIEIDDVVGGGWGRGWGRGWGGGGERIKAVRSRSYSIEIAADDNFNILE